jgi:hypothetical protein
MKGHDNGVSMMALSFKGMDDFEQILVNEYQTFAALEGERKIIDSLKDRLN